MYLKVKVMLSGVQAVPLASSGMTAIKACLKRHPWLLRLFDPIRTPYRVVALHNRMSGALKQGAGRLAVGEVDIHLEPEQASGAGAESHPMRIPLFTLARIPGHRKEIFRATYRGAEGRYTVCFVRGASSITFVNSYAEIPAPVFQRIVQAVLRRFVWTSSIRSQRNLTNYTFMRAEIMDEYVADLSGGVEVYRASLGKKTRYNTRYYWDRLLADFPGITATPFGKGQLTHSDFAHFVKLVGQRYPGDYWREFLLEPVFGLFRDNVVGMVVRNEGEPVAFNIFYLHENEMIFTGNIFDDRYEKYSLGFVTTYRSIIHAASLGLARVVLGGGDFGYKSRLSNSSEPIYECFL